MSIERIFEADVLCKRERVERALHMQPVDRVPLHEQISYNPEVISMYNQKKVNDFDYTLEEIGNVAKKSLDITFPLYAPLGTGEYTEDGFEYKNDNFTKWIKSRPFNDCDGALGWIKNKTKQTIDRIKKFDGKKERADYLKRITQMQELIGQTVLLDVFENGFSDVVNKMGLELFSFFSFDYLKELEDYLSAVTEYQILRVKNCVDNNLYPAVLIAEDFCTKQGSIFSPQFLSEVHYPFIKEFASAFIEKDLFVIYHTDGCFKKEIPNLLSCGVEGFYCLEPNCAMDICELREEYPNIFFAGGVDGVDLMEFSTKEEVQKEVVRIIDETKALEKGGIFIDTSSEINPSIPAENYVAMVNAVSLRYNKKFK